MKEILEQMGVENVEDDVLTELAVRSKGVNLMALPASELKARYEEAKEQLEKKKKDEAEKSKDKPHSGAPLPPGPPVRRL